MRKLMVLPLAGLLALGVVGPVAAGPNVSNTSGTGETIYGDWSTDTGYGYVYLGEETGYGGFGDIYQESGTWVECEPGGEDVPSPKDTGPAEEYFGFVGTRTWGYAYDVKIDFSRRLETGRATGSVELYTETVDECNGVYGGDAVPEVGSLDVTVTGAGPLATFKGSGSYKIPSEFNGHQNYRGTERQANGSVVAGDAIDATLDWGYMSQVTWKEHTNS
jgi:hypothetical protein